jgi:hypothetical protein
MSEKTVNSVEIKVGKEGSLRGINRRTVIVVAIVACVLTGFVIATSVTTVSKLRITFANYSLGDLLVRVYVDDLGERTAVLEPNESVSFSWNLTGWLHKYDIFAHSPDMLVSWFHTWTYIIILPFSEKVITDER